MKRERKALTELPPSELSPWNNPIFRDVEAFLTRIQTYVDIFGSSHVAIPKKGSAKFIKEIKKYGFAMTPIKVEESDLIGRNVQKKLQFFLIERISKCESTKIGG